MERPRSVWKTGMRCRVYWFAEDTWYIGTVGKSLTRRNQLPSWIVQYDDGSIVKEPESLLHELVRPPRRAWEIGDRVQVWWGGDQHYFTGHLEEKIGSSRWSVRYDDGDKRTEPESDLEEIQEKILLVTQKNQTKNKTQHFEKYPIATKTTSSSTASPNFFEDGHKIGDKIKVWWQGENKYFIGTLQSKELRQTSPPDIPCQGWMVHYEDGDRKWEPSHDLKKIHSFISPPSSLSSSYSSSSSTSSNSSTSSTSSTSTIISSSSSSSFTDVDIHANVPRRKRKVRCGKCDGCMRKSCEKCNYCLDKSTNGGTNTLRQ